MGKQVYINKFDNEAAWILYSIYENAMQAGGCLAFTEDGEEDIEKHEELVGKIESLINKILF